MSQGFTLDTPEAVEAFGLLQVHAKLKMEVDRPNGLTWMVSPAQQARAILHRAGRPDPGRTKRKTLEAYRAYLIERGLLQV